MCVHKMVPPAAEGSLDVSSPRQPLLLQMEAADEGPTSRHPCKSPHSVPPGSSHVVSLWQLVTALMADGCPLKSIVPSPQ